MLALVIAVGFGLRLGWALSVHSGLVRGLDMQAYFAAAKNLADGHGLTVRVVFGVGETAGDGGVQALVFPPGYALALGAAFKLFGSTLVVGKLLNVVAGTLTIPFVYFLAKHAYGRNVAPLAALLFAVYPANIFWTSILYSDLLFTLPFAAAVLLGLAQAADPQPRGVFAFGAVLGCATIVRPQAVVVLVAFVGYLCLRRLAARTVLRALMMGVAGVAVCVAPISVWNTARAGHFVLVSDSMGYNLRIGHSPRADGRFSVPPDVAAEAAAGQAPSDWEVARRAMSYAATHPMRELELSARKVYFLYMTDANVIALATTEWEDPIWGSDRVAPRLGATADVFAYSVVLLALASLGMTFSIRDERLFLWLIVFGWTALHILFFGDPRYRLPLLTILIPMASCGLAELWALVASMTHGSPDTVI